MGLTVETDYVVGQAVVVVHEPTWGRDRKARITPDAIGKIGRRWITLASGRRFDPETGELDGGAHDSDETVWPSAEAFQRHAARRSHWSVIVGAAHRRGHNAPDALDDETLARVAAALAEGSEDKA